MLFADIKTVVKGLNKAEKLQLIDFLNEELKKDAAIDPAQYFKSGEEYVFWSPYNEYHAAERLQQLLEESSL